MLKFLWQQKYLLITLIIVGSFAYLSQEETGAISTIAILFFGMFLYEFADFVGFPWVFELLVAIYVYFIGYGWLAWLIILFGLAKFIEGIIQPEEKLDYNVAGREKVGQGETPKQAKDKGPMTQRQAAKASSQPSKKELKTMRQNRQPRRLP